MVQTFKRTHSYHHTTLSGISNRIMGKNITTYCLISRTTFLPDVGFTNIVVRPMEQSGVETKFRVPTVQAQCEIMTEEM